MANGFGRFAAIAAGVIVIGVSVIGYRSFTPTGWVTFSSPDGDFSILLPGEPKIESKEGTTETGASASTIHRVTAEDDTSTFICMYWDLAFTPSDATDAQMTMAGARDGLIETFGGKLLNHEESQSVGRLYTCFPSLIPQRTPTRMRSSFSNHLSDLQNKTRCCVQHD